MGLFQKLKDFGSKVVRGVRKGWDFVRDKVAPVARKILPIAQTFGNAIPQAKPFIGAATNIIDKGLTMMGR